jgi:hypothetical protein
MKKINRSTIDVSCDRELLDKLDKLALLPGEKAWLRVHAGLTGMSGPQTYIDDLEDTMHTLVYLNGCAADTNQDKHAGDIERMYFTLRCLRDAFIEYQKLKNEKD